MTHAFFDRHKKGDRMIWSAVTIVYIFEKWVVILKTILRTVTYSDPVIQTGSHNGKLSSIVMNRN